MGVTINNIIFDICGGIIDDKKFKAVQMGGPSGGCIPAEMCDVKIDYQQINKTGAIMGSGGLVVLDDTDCMVDIARYFLDFTQAESCGKCTFCRVGTRRMLEILESLCDGTAKKDDLEKLAHLANIIGRTGQSNLNFDPAKEQIAGNDQANQYVGRTYRDGHWSVPKLPAV